MSYSPYVNSHFIFKFYLHFHVQCLIAYSFHYHFPDAFMHLTYHALPTRNMQFIPCIVHVILMLHIIYAYVSPCSLENIIQTKHMNIIRVSGLPSSLILLNMSCVRRINYALLLCNMHVSHSNSLIKN